MYPMIGCVPLFDEKDYFHIYSSYFYILKIIRLERAFIPENRNAILLWITCN